VTPDNPADNLLDVCGLGVQKKKGDPATSIGGEGRKERGREEGGEEGGGRKRGRRVVNYPIWRHTP
jgi:hypothetical protein